jgi:hypothetical protein
MPWSFENRVVVPEKPLTSSDTSRTLHESGEEVVSLRGESGSNGFDNADWLMLQGQGFSTAEAALESGRRWRQHLSVAFAHAGFAATFDSVQVESRDGDRERLPEAPGLRVFPQPEPVDGLLLATVGMRAEGKVTRPLDLFLSENVVSAQESNPDGLSRRLELAYITFHSALATENPEVKFILMVTALEALIDDDQKKPEAIVGALAALRDHVAQSSSFDDVRNDLMRLLAEDENESISQLGAKLASQLTSTYAGRSPESFFKHVYGRRSRLLHGALNYTGRRKRPTLREITEILPELRRFVLDMLLAT